MSTALEEAKSQFAETLFKDYKNFIPTQAVYLDIEGEMAINFFYPMLKGEDRFKFLFPENIRQRSEHLLPSGVDTIVIFSGGGYDDPDEKQKLIQMLGNHIFAGINWVNLHAVLRNKNNKKIKKLIRDSRYCRFHSEKRIRYSLENLEHVFGLTRDISIRSHNHCYKDLGGGRGEMQILSTIQRYKTKKSSSVEIEKMKAYCKKDVESMFKITSVSEKRKFTKKQRYERRRSPRHVQN